MYRITLYDTADKPVGEPFELPALPPHGTVILWDGGAWLVFAVQVVPTHPRSPAARDGDTTVLADVRARPTDGIHDA